MGFWKKVLLVFGIILWVGTLSPEVFVRPGIGCIFDENEDNQEIDVADGFMEAFFYGDEPVEVNFRFALVDILGGNGRK